MSLLLLTVFLSIYSSFNCDLVSQRGNNKKSHITHGNKKGFNSIKITHWNKGLSFFHNKVDHTKYLIGNHKPNIFSISEVNYIIDRENIDARFDSYNIEYTDQKCNYNISRQILLIDSRLEYKRRDDLKNKNDCCIWIEVFLKKQKP